MTLFDIVDALLGALSLVALVPVLVLFAELVAGSLKRAKSAPLMSAGERPSLAVLMPAHDEAAGIATAIDALRTQLATSDRLLVVADNCSDGTAEVARAHGAEVAVRSDPSRRGKGYALDFGVRVLAASPPAIVVIIDADCIVSPGALEHLARACSATARPVQALYLMRAPQPASPAKRLAEFAWLVKNKTRPLGAAHLGWPCQLMGTGMAFPWASIQGAALASGHLVEDMQLGLDMAAAGTPPLFCPQAQVNSVFPSDREGARSQRTRWEHGHLAVIGTMGPRLLWRAVRHSDAGLLAMALDLIVPPLAALGLVLVVLTLAEAGWWALGHSAWPFLIASLALALMAAGVAAAWRSGGRQIVSLSEMAALPLYVLAKIPMYLRLFTRRQTQWVRTKRDEHQP